MTWWLSLIIALVSNLPEIISVIKELVALISNLGDGKLRNRSWGRLAKAIQAFRKDGDSKPLKELHDELKGTVGKAPDTVGLG